MQTDQVFAAVQRGYNELEQASHGDILAYFDGLSPDAMVGHVSNIKGIVFEQMVADQLAEQGISATLFEATNHPIVEITLWSDSDIAYEAQLKATESVSYIEATLEEYPDIPIIATAEVANAIDSEMVINSGISSEELTMLVDSTLSGAEVADFAVASDIIGDSVGDAVGDSILSTVADVALPVSPLGLIGFLFGLF